MNRAEADGSCGAAAARWAAAAAGTAVARGHVRAPPQRRRPSRPVRRSTRALSTWRAQYSGIVPPLSLKFHTSVRSLDHTTSVSPHSFLLSRISFCGLNIYGSIRLGNCLHHRHYNLGGKYTYIIFVLILNQHLTATLILTTKKTMECCVLRVWFTL